MSRQVTSWISTALAVFGVALVGGIVLRSESWPNARAVPEPRRIQPEYAQTAIYASAYQHATADPITPVLGVIVNHHLLAIDFIADTLQAAASTDIRRVILISPNHFGAGAGRVQTTAATWVTPDGEIAGDPSVVNRLSAGNLVQLDDQLWSGEHGVYNIVPMIKHYFPRARLVPLVVKDGTSDERIDALAIALQAAVDGQTLVIGSFDFSHYTTSAIADAHDAVSQRAVEALDVAAVADLDIDSRPGLRLILQLMRGAGASRFTTLHHDNSARLTEQLASIETTSYITGVFRR